MSRRPLVGRSRWTPEDDQRLRALAADGRSAAVIAERLKRSQGAVHKRAQKLGVTFKRVALRLKVKGK
jgi:hypothetical protein